jgi:hypothetical protein
MFDFNRNYMMSRVKYVLLSKLRLAAVSVAAHERRRAGQPGGTWGMGDGRAARACTGSGMWKCRLAAATRTPYGRAWRP